MQTERNVHTHTPLSMEQRTVLSIIYERDKYKDELGFREQDNIRLENEVNIMRTENRRLAQEVRDLMSHIRELQEQLQIQAQLQSYIQPYTHTQQNIPQSAQISIQPQLRDPPSPRPPSIPRTSSSSRSSQRTSQRVERKQSLPSPPPDIETKYELTCGICHEIPIAPYSTHCNHIFCHDCMMGCIRNKYTRCPTCRAMRAIPTAEQFMNNL